MPVSTSMAAIASSQTAIASAAAHRARVAQCKATMPNYDAQTATVAEMRDYAGCVETLYPVEIGGGWIIAFKLLFVIAIVGMVIGAWRGWRFRQDYTETVLEGLFGFVIAPCAVAFVAGVALGIWWLFT